MKRRIFRPRSSILRDSHAAELTELKIAFAIVEDGERKRRMEEFLANNWFVDVASQDLTDEERLEGIPSRPRKPRAVRTPLPSLYPGSCKAA